MAFNCRPATYTTACSWDDGWCRLTVESISSPDGGPASIPLSRLRGYSMHLFDATIDLFVTHKDQLLVWGPAAAGGASAASSSTAVVMGEMERPRSPHHFNYLFNLLRGFAGIDADSAPCVAVMLHLYVLPTSTPRHAFRYVQDQLAAVLHEAAARAVFLGHEAIRFSVKVDLAAAVPFDGRDPRHYRAAALWTPCRLEVATGPVFDIDAPAKPSPGRCAACGWDVKVGSMLGEGPCGHTYHPACIRRRVRESGTCTMCNALIRGSDVKLSLFLACPGRPPLSSSVDDEPPFYPSIARS